MRDDCEVKGSCTASGDCGVDAANEQGIPVCTTAVKQPISSATCTLFSEKDPVSSSGTGYSNHKGSSTCSNSAASSTSSVLGGQKRKLESSEPFEKRQPSVRADGRKHVEKGSLNEAELIEAKLIAQKILDNKDLITEADKHTERRAANRLSAFQSRQRRKIVIKELQRQNAQLVDENARQIEVIEKLKWSSQLLLQENQRLRTESQLFSSGAAAAHFGVGAQRRLQEQLLPRSSQNTDISALLFQEITHLQSQQARSLHGGTNAISLGNMLGLQQQAMHAQHQPATQLLQQQQQNLPTTDTATFLQLLAMVDGLQQQPPPK